MGGHHQPGERRSDLDRGRIQQAAKRGDKPGANKTALRLQCAAGQAHSVRGNVSVDGDAPSFCFCCSSSCSLRWRWRHHFRAENEMSSTKMAISPQVRPISTIDSACVQ